MPRVLPSETQGLPISSTETDGVVRCFVVGSSRSGTTLLAVLLGRHSQLAMTPETHFYTEVLPHVEGATAAQVESILAGWRRLPELELSPQAVITRCGEDLRPSAIFQAMLAMYAESKGKPYCGEKSPIHSRFVHEILRDFPAARVLHLLRDGRAVVRSILDLPWWNNGLEPAVEHWLDAALRIEELQASYPDRFLIVRYETLVERPEATLRDVMNFIGFELESSQFDTGILSQVVLERSLPWKRRALGPVEMVRATHWRSAFTECEIAYLSRLMEKPLRRFGYL